MICRRVESTGLPALDAGLVQETVNELSTPTVCVAIGVLGVPGAPITVADTTAVDQAPWLVPLTPATLNQYTEPRLSPVTVHGDVTGEGVAQVPAPTGAYVPFCVAAW